jgi:hypothetical protein
MRRLAAALLVLAAQVTSAAPVHTPVSDRGNANGSERCLIGSGLVGGACASVGTFSETASLTQIYAGRVDGGNLVRIDDESDKLWSALDGASFQVRRFGSYVSSATAVRGGIGGADASSFLAFPSAAEMPLADTYLGPQAVMGEPNDADGFFFLTPWETLATGADPFALVLDAYSLGRRYTSNNGGAGNVGYSDALADHMVTFQATVDGETRFLVGFERLNVDKDFQDAVYELRGITPVPEPGTLALFLAGAVVLFTIGSRRLS